MISRLRRAATAESVTVLAPGSDTAFTLIGDDWSAGFSVSDGSVVPHDDVMAEFTLAATDELWDALISPRPRRDAHSLIQLVRAGSIAVRGSVLAYERSIHVVRALIDAARATAGHADTGGPLTARGSYHRVTTSLGTSDVYVERAGSGAPLLTFATAGSDTSQWHGMMTHTSITDHYELITADLPWHGRSSPAWGRPVGSYALTPETYTEWIVAVADALALEQPIIVGVSMGGAAVVHAVATHPHRFAGAVSCQAAVSVAARAHKHLRSTEVNSSLFIPEWVSGLMNPASPREFTDRVWWGYSSGGFGLYAADIDSYLSWDFEHIEQSLTSESPHIAVLSGAFDTSVPSERSRELADRIPNASFALMPELGHFPHAENPPVFAQHLREALGRVLVSRSK
ncbi:alpha/beta fold hydrolase [Leucobacter tardus]|uniref:Alpha/beta hydrolase n=1 Tax=Leucobacter tardus TaxID=501483 RepID=A0A939QE16_9MICO|nr:alpha/beta hydrolase [Leucobacter tardus]MBO2989155.1 alpha/beta hydrolase [Leucobacter tardus]